MLFNFNQTEPKMRLVCHWVLWNYICTYTEIDILIQVKLS